ncbi:MAG: hypothetical protein A2X12_06455 [Bacteroidetes bacterium GWE2_29_8]|nr:MAG: hypothetical protein A2X12_06455 [Bacteroidetes bacterium GWE2_29_8]
MKSEDKNKENSKCIADILKLEFLNTEEKKMIKDNVVSIIYPKDTIICKQDEEIEYLYFLKSGIVKFYKQDNNTKKLSFITYDNIFINILSIFKNIDIGKKNEYTLLAAEECEVCLIKIDVVKELLMKNGDFSYHLIKEIATGSLYILNTYVSIYRRQVKERIAFLILFFREYYNDNSYSFPLSRVEMAEMLDVARENIIRTLQEFNKDGIVELKGKKITIKNLDILLKLNKMGK